MYVVLFILSFFVTISIFNFSPRIILLLHLIFRRRIFIHIIMIFGPFKPGLKNNLFLVPREIINNNIANVEL